MAQTRSCVDGVELMVAAPHVTDGQRKLRCMSYVLSSQYRRFLTIFNTVVGVLACNMLLVSPVVADELVAAAIFPFELVIEKQMSDGIMPPTANKAQQARLKLMDEKLQKLLVDSGKYSQVDLSSLSKKIEDASPVHECNGCDIDLAREAGAKVSVIGVVRKASNALINVSIFIKDVASGELVAAGAVSIREDNDSGWLRAVRSVVRNRILKRSR